MFVKAVSPPIIILLLKMLYRRLPFNHPKKKDVEEMLARRKAGYNGEKSLVYYLDQKPAEEFLIFHNLRLTDHSKKFQMDFLLVSPKLLLILEVKNFAGELYFDKDFGQLFRTYKGKMECFPDPIAQVESQQFHLENWLQTHKFPSIPIQHLVVISNPSSIVRASNGYKKAYEVVCKSDHLHNKMNVFAKKYTQPIWDAKLISKAKKLLLMQDTQIKDNVMEMFDIHPKDLLPGVFCPNCGYRPMEFKRSSWYCPSCKLLDHDAHKEAISDYFQLIEPEINNEKIREFLGIPSQRQATYVLNQLNLGSSGKNKKRIYFPI